MRSRWWKHGHLPFLLIVVRPAFPALWMWVNVIPSVTTLATSCSVFDICAAGCGHFWTRGGSSCTVTCILGIHCRHNNPRLPTCCFNKFIPYYTNRRQQPSLLFHWFLLSYFWLHPLRQYSLHLHLVTLNFLHSFYISCRIKYTRFVWDVLHYSPSSLLFHILTAMLTVLNIKICLVITYQACYTSLLFLFVHTIISMNTLLLLLFRTYQKSRLFVAYSFKISSIYIYTYIYIHIYIDTLLYSS